MADTYKALSTVTVGAGGAASITFSNIPQTFTDLVIQLSARTNRSAPAENDDALLQINGITTGYAGRAVEGNGSTAFSFDAGITSGMLLNQATSAGATANVYNNATTYLPNYTSSTFTKISGIDYVTENNGTFALQGLSGNLSSITAPITSLTYTPRNGNLFVQNTTATLYGVFNADVSTAPAIPTIGTATAGVGEASVTFTPVSNAASYTMTSTPGNITASGTRSPIVVTGLTGGTSYSFKVKSNNPFGSSGESAASNSVTPLTAGYESIATAYVPASTNEIIFNSIPSTFTHLQLRMTARGSATDVLLQFNGDTGSNYDIHFLVGTGASIVAGNSMGRSSIGWKTLMSTANTFSVGFMDILDYRNTNKNKVTRALSGDSDVSNNGAVVLHSGLWKNTSAITSIRIFLATGTFDRHTDFALYGIRSA